MTKYVYDFTEGKADMKELLGGKGANMAEMTNLGVPVPFGFTITTEACDYYSKNSAYPKEMDDQVKEKLKLLEEKMGKTLGNPENPLLVSVRSGAAASLPGMMDTVLNLGLNTEVVEGMIKKTGNERFVRDSFRRFIQMFGDVVMNVPHHNFEKILQKKKETKGVEFDTDLTADDLKELAEEYKAMVKDTIGKDFPEDPMEQLNLSVNAVFASWNNERAVLYRKLNDIRGLIGTAVNIQAMVFGNMGDTSGTGVCFTRDPATGENVFYGEYLMNAQGEDVVAGIRTPKQLESLGDQNPELYKELCDIRETLEKHWTDMQDMEFTIEEGKLYMLQTRIGKRTAAAAVKIAVDMVDEGLIDKKTAVLRVDANSLNQLLHKQLDPIGKQKNEAVTKGLPASPGAAVGEVVFDAHKAHDLHEAGKKVILVRKETSPEDLIGMNAAEGILTSRGGMTSHAAVVARGMGKCCVSGCSDVVVNEKEGHVMIKDQKVNEGEFISLDGGEGEVFVGKIPTVDPELTGNFAKLMEWADEFRTLKVRTNAETSSDVKNALKFGAEGIGLARTEHMFFEGERINVVREMILAKDLEGRKNALNKLLPMQKDDFKEIFELMSGKPVTIRLLDPPLHEFLPKEDADYKEVSKALDVPVSELKKKAEELHEENPMLGHRGCRLSIYYPEIAEMQARAIFEAAKDSAAAGQKPIPEIEVPLVGNVKEYVEVANVIKKVAEEIGIDKKEIPYSIGTMIEVPRACVTADQIAKEAEFFSFGTNDLTQMGCGFSRDDSGKFLKDYMEKNIFEGDPFATIDQEGVGELMKICVEKGRKTKPNLEIGICGEQGGEPKSVEFCHKIGLNFVSCSPFRVPIARLSAAQAALKNK